jgi:hypothetical protein
MSILYDTGSIENTASNNSSIVACLFVATGSQFPNSSYLLSLLAPLLMWGGGHAFIFFLNEAG